MNNDELPDNPASLIIRKMREQHDDPDVFAFEAKCPNNQHLTVAVRFGPGIVALTLAKDFAAAMLDELIKRGDTRMANETVWPSAAAMIQKLLIDFNRQRGYEKPSGLLGPDGRLLQ